MAPTYTLRGWVVCLIASLLCFYEFVQLMMFNAINAGLMTTFHISATKIGVISACYLVANLIFIFPTGMALDRLSTRKLMITALLLFMIGTFCFSLSTSVLQAMAARFVTGIGGAAPFLACLKLASRWIAPRYIALISGLMVTIMMLGGVAGQTPVVLLVHALGWRHALWVDVALGGLFLPLLLFFVRNYPPDYPINKNTLNSFAYQHLVISLRKVITQPTNWLLAIYACLLNLPVMLLGAIWGSLFLTQQTHLDATHASYVTSMIFLGTIVGAPIIGALSDRMERRKLPMIVFALLSIVIIIITVYSPALTFHQLILLFFMLGVFTSSQILVYPSITEHNEPNQVGAALGLASSIIMGGAGLFQALFGQLMDLGWQGKMLKGIPFYSVANYHHVFSIFPLTFLISLLAVLLFKEHKPAIIQTKG